MNSCRRACCAVTSSFDSTRHRKTTMERHAPRCGEILPSVPARRRNRYRRLPLRPRESRQTGVASSSSRGGSHTHHLHSGDENRCNGGSSVWSKMRVCYCLGKRGDRMVARRRCGRTCAAYCTPGGLWGGSCVQEQHASKVSDGCIPATLLDDVKDFSMRQRAESLPSIAQKELMARKESLDWVPEVHDA